MTAGGGGAKEAAGKEPFLDLWPPKAGECQGQLWEGGGQQVASRGESSSRVVLVADRQLTEGGCCKVPLHGWASLGAQDSPFTRKASH